MFGTKSDLVTEILKRDDTLNSKALFRLRNPVLEDILMDLKENNPVGDFAKDGIQLIRIRYKTYNLGGDK